MEIIKGKRSIVAVIFFMLLSAIAFGYVDKRLYLLFFLASFSYFYLSVKKIYLNRDQLYFVLFYFICVCLMGGINFFVYWDFSTLVSVLLTLAPLCLAVVFISDKEKCLKASKYSLLLLQTLIILSSLIIGFNNFPIVNPLEKITPEGSYNGISSIIIVMQLCYSYLSLLLTKRTPIFSTVLTLVICFIGYGRGSLMIALVIFVFSLWYSDFFNKIYSLRVKNLKLPFTLKLLFVIAIVFALAYNINFIQEYFTRYTKFGGGYESSHRINIIFDYIERLDIVTLFVGNDYENTLINFKYNGNPHNSFIRAHHYFGLPYLVMILLIPIILVIKLLNKPKGILAALFILCLYIRGFTEIILAPNILDIYFFLIVLVTLEHKDKLSLKVSQSRVLLKLKKGKKEQDYQRNDV